MSNRIGERAAMLDFSKEVNDSRLPSTTEKNFGMLKEFAGGSKENFVRPWHRHRFELQIIPRSNKKPIICKPDGTIYKNKVLTYVLLTEENRQHDLLKLKITMIYIMMT